MEAPKYKYICADCGCVHEDKNGFCIYGHDNWIELGGEGILPYQVETFEKNLYVPISVVFQALTGDDKSLDTIYQAHKEWLKDNNVQLKSEDII